MGKRRGAYSVLVGKPEGKRALGRPGRIILKLIFNKWNGSMHWIGLAQDSNRWFAFLNAVINLRAP